LLFFAPAYSLKSYQKLETFFLYFLSLLFPKVVSTNGLDNDCEMDRTSFMNGDDDESQEIEQQNSEQQRMVSSSYKIIKYA